MCINYDILSVLLVYILPQVLGIAAFILLRKKNFSIRMSAALIPAALYGFILYGFCSIQGTMFKEGGFVLCSGFCRQTAYTTLQGMAIHLVVACILILGINKYVLRHR